MELRILLVALLAFVGVWPSGCTDKQAGKPVPAPRAVSTGSAPPPMEMATDVAERPRDSGTAEAIAPAPRTKLVLLGTGTPSADPDRSGPSLAIVVDGVPYLVDMGPGVVRRATGAHRAGILGLRPERLTRLFVTHLHSDHTVGFPDLIFTPWVLGRSEPLRVWGPPGLEAMAQHVKAAWSVDVEVRIEGKENGNAEGHRVVVQEIAPGLVYEDDRVKVTAFSVSHGSWKSAFGYRFDTPDRSIVVSGDTAPTEAVTKACDGCDILVHEVYSARSFSRLPSGVRAYHSAFHTSAVQLASIARRARPKLLVLNHQLFWGASEEALVSEVEAHYDGRVVSGRDLSVY